MRKCNTVKLDTSEKFMSADTKAMQRVVDTLAANVRRAKKPASLAKAAREERQKTLLGDYQTEDDVMDAYGYEMITQEECRQLLNWIQQKKEPAKMDLSEEELYMIELQQILRAALERLQTLKWDDLPEEEKQKIRHANEAFSERLKADRLHCESVFHEMAG